ncbi:MAG: DUF2911 domain-containing protein [Flavobacteriales bacterium]|nr:DUF2911 domain-containing protein [Flavobacteriales bacterium]
MKKIFIAALCVCTIATTAQIKTPQPSPAATVIQTVGLTEVEIVYSRPAKRDRVIFGDLVPYNELWRTGADSNTTLTTSELLIFGNDTLAAGTYALYTKPAEGAVWEVIFYSASDNWGTPEKWNAELVALTVKASVKGINDVVESFTISIDDVTADGANLVFAWDKTKAVVAFAVPTKTTVMAMIDKVMAGPASRDYYNAAIYYLDEKKDLETALEWVDKAITMRDEQPFWMLRKKSLIQAELKDYKGAIATANLSLEAAKKAEYASYIKMNEESIKEWSSLK